MQLSLHQLLGLGSAVSFPSGVRGGVPAAKRFVAFYRRQMALPGISKASGHGSVAKSTGAK